MPHFSVTPKQPKSMNKHIITLLMLCAFAAPLTSCNTTKGPASKIGSKIDDALDARPAEGLRDAVEKITQ
jgi:predicted small secreted protein